MGKATIAPELEHCPSPRFTFLLKRKTPVVDLHLFLVISVPQALCFLIARCFLVIVITYLPCPTPKECGIAEGFSSTSL
jgi:hypothetical protein